MARMVKKAGLAQKIFQTNGTKQSSVSVPMPQKKEYGTGASYTKAVMKKRKMK